MSGTKPNVNEPKPSKPENFQGSYLGTCVSDPRPCNCGARPGSPHSSSCDSLYYYILITTNADAARERAVADQAKQILHLQIPSDPS